MYEYKYFKFKKISASLRKTPLGSECYNCLYFPCLVLPKAALWLRRAALSGAYVGASSPEWHMDDK